jgi:ATP-dependent DNA helicase RecQ
MLEYASQTAECRSRFLLRYFGQSESRDCGTCDVCRSRKAPAASGDGETASKLMEFIESKGGVYSLKDIVAEFGNPAKGMAEDYLDVLRELIDDGVVPVYES